MIESQLPTLTTLPSLTYPYLPCLPISLKRYMQWISLVDFRISTYLKTRLSQKYSWKILIIDLKSSTTIIMYFKVHQQKYWNALVLIFLVFYHLENACLIFILFYIIVEMGGRGTLFGHIFRSWRLPFFWMSYHGNNTFWTKILFFSIFDLLTARKPKYPKIAPNFQNA